MVLQEGDHRGHPPDKSIVLPRSGETEASIVNPFFNKDLISADELTPEKLAWLFQITPLMETVHLNSIPCRLLEGRILVPLFYEPSTRTKTSHQTAMIQLGGAVSPVEDPIRFSSFAKGARFKHEIIAFAIMGDLLVMRHQEMGSAQKAAEFSHVPVINAGDGNGEHPTQALLDVLTIWRTRRRLDDLTVVLGGDLLNGRTIHSLIKILANFKNNRFILASPEELKLPEELKRFIEGKGVVISEHQGFTEEMKEADIWYWTRVQKERFENEQVYERMKNLFIINPDVLDRYARKDMTLMHPLPIVTEIAPEVDDDPRAIYLHPQMRNGVYSRMALIAGILIEDLTPDAIIDSIPRKFRPQVEEFRSLQLPDLGKVLAKPA